MLVILNKSKRKSSKQVINDHYTEDETAILSFINPTWIHLHFLSEDPYNYSYLNDASINEGLFKDNKA